MEPKTVCYLATRKLYDGLKAPIMSALLNGNIDQAVLFVEDDEIGYKLPGNVLTVNVSNQKFFRSDGPNFYSRWTYMILMKTAVCYLLPDLDRALVLDCDTIVHRDISPLWGLDMDGYCVAGCREPYWQGHYGREYVNGGMLFWNLNEMRQYGAEPLIRALNETRYDLKEQDAISEVLEGRILRVDGSYNECPYTERPTEAVRIRHYANWGQKRFLEDPEVRKYMQMGWNG